MSDDVIRIFDTTLRDGEQSPGCSMTMEEKLEVAGALVELGVDVLEAGFPIASPGDFAAVREVARKYGDRTIICGLARCIKEDIDRAWEALREAEQSRIHVFLATSAIHREFKLKMAKEEIVRRTAEMVAAPANTAKISNFHRKTPRARNSIFCARWWKQPSGQARLLSTSPIRWAMRPPAITFMSSAR